MKNTKIFCLTPSEPGEPAFQSWLHKKWPIQNGENEPLLSSRLNARLVENFNFSLTFSINSILDYQNFDFVWNFSYNSILNIFHFFKLQLFENSKKKMESLKNMYFGKILKKKRVPA